MIVDLILDRREVEKSDCIMVSENRLDGFYIPILECYPKENVPENLRNGYVYKYNPRIFYHETLAYGKIGDGITAAMDYGGEEDVKRELCAYIDKQEYNPEIKEYINSVNWIS